MFCSAPNTICVKLLSALYRILRTYHHTNHEVHAIRRSRAAMITLPLVGEIVSFRRRDIIGVGVVVGE